MFPALGYGAVLSAASHIPDDAFLVAAQALAEMVPAEELRAGSLFPSFAHIEDVSARLAAAVAAHAEAEGYGQRPPGGLPQGGWLPYVRSQMWRPAEVHIAAARL